MPELPEVETSVQALREQLLGETFTGVHVTWPRHVEVPNPEELQRRITGRTVVSANRRGKYMIFGLSEGEFLIVHLRMTGHLSVVAGDAPLKPHTHTVFTLSSGRELRFQDVRKFGRVYLVRDPDEVLGKLGPEPLAPSFTPAVLAQQLKGRSMRLKPLLLDQTFIAGVGNIYADEALFYAYLHPKRRADSLTEADVSALHAAVQKVLRLGIDRGGASIDRYRKPDGTSGEMQDVVAVFGRNEEPCYRCGAAIERIVLAGRGTHFCPSCQS